MDVFTEKSCFRVHSRIEHGVTYRVPLDQPCATGDDCWCYTQGPKETEVAKSAAVAALQEPLAMAQTITAAPVFEKRQAVQSDFAVWTWHTSGTINYGIDSCPENVAAMIEQDLSPQLVFCATDGYNPPSTTYYPYNSWPSTGCLSESRESCCPSEMPQARTEYYDGGLSRILYCATTPQVSAVTDLRTSYSGTSVSLTPYTYTSSSSSSSSTSSSSSSSSTRTSSAVTSASATPGGITSSGLSTATSMSSSSIISGEAQSSTASSSPTGVVKSTDNSGLSTGAKVGLGVGIPLGVILLLAIGYMAFRLRGLHKGDRKPREDFPPPDYKYHNPGMAEAHGDSMSHFQPPAELSTESAPGELDSRPITYK